jgi:hypothetical protein
VNTTTQCNEPAVPHVTLPFDLRDYFAAKAMQSIVAVLHQGLRPEDCIKVAEDAYFVADVMLKAREQ